MSTAACDPLKDFTHRFASCVRLLLSDKPFEVESAKSGIQRLLNSDDLKRVDIHVLADRIEHANGGLSENDKQKIRSEIENARAIGYAEGVRAAEARFRPHGQLEFGEVALFVEREINRLPPDKHEFIHKMALYAQQGFEPSPKQGKFLFDLFVRYFGGRIT